MYPKLRFLLDAEFDEWTCSEFLTFDEKDIFSNSILKNHPNLKILEKKDKEKFKSVAKEYIKKYYKKHLHELETARKDSERKWKGVSKSFFKKVDKLFKNYPWATNGNYICYLSIFNCNPRFIKDKEFQAFYKHPSGVQNVCIHEMLHFMFYDYIQTKFTSDCLKLGEHNLWKLSEIFNDIVLSTPESNIYAETDEEFKLFKSMWNKSKDVDSFFKSATALLLSSRT